MRLNRLALVMGVGALLAGTVTAALAWRDSGDTEAYGSPMASDAALDHYFHHPVRFQPHEKPLLRAVQLALQDTAVAASLKGRRHAVQGAERLTEDKYRPCEKHVCVRVLVNYLEPMDKLLALEAFVDVSQNEVWEVHHWKLSYKPMPLIDGPEAERLVIERYKATHKHAPSVTARIKADMEHQDYPSCRYHGCYGILVLEEPAGQVLAVAVFDRIDGSMGFIETALEQDTSNAR